MDWLGETEIFMKRWQCCQTNELAGPLGVAMVVGAILAASSYLVIIMAIHVFRVNWLKEARAWAAYTVLFQCVFFMCGLTHLCTALAFVWPAYRLFTLVEIANGVFGFFAAISLLVIALVHPRLAEVQDGR